MPVPASQEALSFPGGDAGALVIHGLTSTPASMFVVAEALAEAGFTVEVPLLPGHGTSVEDLHRTGWGDWTAAVDRACADLFARCASVVVVGQSMGGTLALWLAAEHPEIAGVVAINPFVEPVAASFMDMLAQTVAANVLTSPPIASDIAAPGVEEAAYEEMSVPALISLLGGIADLSGRLGSIRCQVLLLSSRKDHVVPPSSGDYLLAALGDRCERVWLEDSYHVATLDNDKEAVSAGAVAFAKRAVFGPR